MVTRQRRLRSAAIFGLLALAALVTLALTACDRINPPSPLLEEKIRRPLLGDAIVLDPTVTYQTMVGWGATAQAGQSEFASDYPKWRDQVMDLSVNEVGINRVRLEIPSGLESPVDYFTPYINGETDRSILKERRYAPKNDNDDPASINPDGFQFAALDHTIDHVVLPMKRRVEANGERLYVNLNYVGFNEDATLHRANPDEYAELMLATFQHMQADYGFVPDAIEIILEPDLAGWNGKEIGQAIVATGRTLETNGFNIPAFIGPSTTSMSSAIGYFEEMIDVPGVSDYLTEVSYHRYRGASESNAQKLADRAAEYGLQTAMLEHIGADYNELHQDLTVGNNSSWQQYTLAFPVEDNGAQYIVLSSPEDQMPGVQIGRRTRYLQQYFKYIRAGAQRIEATRMEGFSPAAFINSNGGYVVVVKAELAGDFTVRGLPPGRYGFSYTVEDETSVELKDSIVTSGSPEIKTGIPAAGVITIYSK